MINKYIKSTIKFIYFYIEASRDWLDANIIEKIYQRNKNQINNEDELVIQSQVHRTQDSNLRDCIEKL